MFLHHGDYVIFRLPGSDRMIVAKIRILGEVINENENIEFIPQPEFWDTSKSADPTIRVWNSVQFQFYGIKREELESLSVSVSTDKGMVAECYNEFEDNGEYIVEYSSRYPIIITIENSLIGKRTIFNINWRRKNHYALPNNYVFLLEINRRQEFL